ncbi:MAG: RnfABCDGE type electron transport complex subunit D [Clostridiales bacterium]|nr:RnfABCDGE type electron transport complex subunit D [Clostridiales bacterium]
MAAELKNTIKSYNTDLLLMLTAPAAVACYYYGARAVKLMLAAVLTSLVLEVCGGFVLKRRADLRSMGFAFNGLCVALLLPAGVQYWMVVAGVAFAVIFAKLPFGNSEKSPFVPAAAGVAFLTICWPDYVFRFSAVGSEYIGGSFSAGTSLSGMLAHGNSINNSTVSLMELFVGEIPGAMGTVCIIALLGSAVYLLIRRPKKFLSAISFIAVCAVYAAVFPRISAGALLSVTMELCSGSLIFCALFFMTDFYTSPEKPVAGIVYGAAGGLITMLLRTFGVYEESAVFAVLLVNAVSPLLSRSAASKAPETVQAEENVIYNPLAGGEQVE